MWTRSRYNPETLQMEEVKLTGREIFQLVGLRVAFVLAIGAGSVWLFDQVFQSPADRARDREIAFLERQLEEKDRQLEEKESELCRIRDGWPTDNEAGTSADRRTSQEFVMA